ncbi:early endosome antigen 1 isoform X1 [Solanum pennellii]|uniref:Early endosome antigen 1 isoform X1 n=2 Tax=Solanum pennellii TaxID=28526 RepID=A0ABM1GGE4_SOLPN|nr:early endosome antigen 1 isoform X1 [Solanum pennellii]XP_027771355.1 early endosome antigen 1 isoform X1 [Solanum pennellii]XP_027771356.1 early endosome antigen 1 isoform X1 [Solanum pennellii]
MFKSSKWKKEKIKTVFQMQFQVTQVPKLKAKKLMISLVPADAGKPTVRLGKAAIIEGTCSWENPIYETVKLIRDPKTGKFKQNIYYFAVASGSSKSGFLGEVGLDFADLVEATESLVVSLPLMPLETGAILHVAVQNMQGAQETRPTEDSDISRTESLDQSFETELGSNGHYGNGHCTSTEDGELNETFHYSMQNSIPRDPQPKNSLVKQFTSQNAINPLERHLHQRSSTDCSLGSDLDGSVTDTTHKSEEDLLRDTAQETSSNSFEFMKNKIVMLERQAELSEMELQTLRKQIVKETKRAQEQSRQISNLKEARDVLKIKCEKLNLRCTDEVNAVASDNAGADDKKSTALLEEIRHKLQKEKNLNSKLMLKLQKTEDSNSELILTVRDLNKMLDQKDKDISYLSEKVRSNKDLLEAAAERTYLKIDQNEDRKAKELKFADESQSLKQTIEKLQDEIEVYKTDSNEMKAQMDQLESHCQVLEDEIEVYKRDNDEMKAQMDQLESHCQVLEDEIEVYKRDNNKMKALMDQLESHCQVLEKENDDINRNLEQCELQNLKTQQEHSESLASIKHFKLQVERLEEEMTTQTSQYSKSLDTINELETHVSVLEKELETQSQEFEEHLEAVTQDKVKQEQRAIKAEEGLRRARWSNAKAAQKLQEELKRLSDEMTLKIDEKEELVNDAVTEANVLREENKVLEELLQKSEEELKSTKEHYEREVLELKASSVEIGRLDLAGSAYCKQMKHREKVRYDTEQMEKSTAETEVEQKMTIQKELERELASVRREAEMFLEELIPLRTEVDEKKILEETLQSEVEKLHLQNDELRCSTNQLKLENENLMKLVLKLQEQEDEPPAEATQDSIVAEGRKCMGENIHHQGNGFTEGINVQNGSRKIVNITRREVDSGRVAETINGQSQNTHDPEELRGQVALLTERNKHMEHELKDMQERYSEISLKFAEVEGERQQLVMALRNFKNGKK